jgi:hypothetical protein
MLSEQKGQNMKESTTDLCLRIVDLLEDYEGEPIVAHEHPIHLAIQELELRCVPIPQDRKSRRKQALLFQPARNVWFSMLWASRDGCPNYKTAKEFLPIQIAPLEADRPRQPALAKMWANELAAVLLEWSDPKVFAEVNR